ncbi:hypothetical protein G4B88_028570 [Cannabis sativa]|uniref:Fe2OG dioxygenase domain-containing protein n=1 Tax=Cannabis sativa TaxID=3483 RepID=A0A7J6F1Q6_CANSA|nr:hypothetical protein G4B88_028570 [Cannabis sativa]
MATDFKSIPIIDVSPLLAKCDDPKMGEDGGVIEVVRQLNQACTQAGFFYVKGHGIPISLLQEVKEKTHKFFELPYEEKSKIKLNAAAGYSAIENLNLELMVRLEKFWKDIINDLSRNIMRGIALALGGSPYEFEGDRAGDPFWVVRILGYPKKPFENGVNDIGCGAHTDYGLLTLLNQEDGINALEVRNLSGKWISAPPIPGTFVCNIGDMLKVEKILDLVVSYSRNQYYFELKLKGFRILSFDKLQIYSNGLYESTLHRVINNSDRYRVSVAYFYETNFHTAVEPLDICKQRNGKVNQADETKKVERAVYGEHLVGKVLTNFVF